MEHDDHPRPSWFAVLGNLGCYIPREKCSKKKYDNAGFEPASGSLQVMPLTVALRLVSIREARANVFLLLMHIGRMDRTQSQPALTGVDVSSKVCGGYTIAGLRILPEVTDHIYEKVI